jgi:hypothetical protein
MKFATMALALIVLGALGHASIQARENSEASVLDPYQTELVNSAIRWVLHGGGLLAQVKTFLYGTPSLPQMGDAVAVAVLKIWTPAQLAEPNNAGACLVVLGLGFSDKNAVVREADKHPQVTMFVLDYLEEKEVSQPKLEKRIATTKDCVQQFTCPGGAPSRPSE